MKTVLKLFFKILANNLEEKIQYVLDNPDKINQIRLNGHKKFLKGYDLKKRANILIEKINDI